MAGRKTVEERIALIDAKIAKKREEIAALETQKHKLQNLLVSFQLRNQHHKEQLFCNHQ